MRRAADAALLLPALLCAAISARAQGCDNTQTQTALDQCAGRSLQRSDAALNVAYGHVVARLKGNAEAARLLVASERAWVKFRDADCAFAASGVQGGSIQPMIETQCRDGLTQDRTRQLTAWLHCAEGDLSCPVPPPQ